MQLCVGPRAKLYDQQLRAFYSFLKDTYSADRHLVGGEGACLVGADNRCTAQGLHWGQAANDGILLGHATRAEGQAGGDDSRQAFRDGGHSQGHSNLKVIDGPSDPRAAVDGVSEVADVDDPHSHADQGDDLGELLAELIQLLLQRRLLLFCGCHLISDLTDLCGNAGSDDNTYGTTCSDVCALREEERQQWVWGNEATKKKSNQIQCLRKLII